MVRGSKGWYQFLYPTTPYKNSDSEHITTQKLDRLVLRTIRKGIRTSKELLKLFQEIDAGDLRLSIQRLIVCDKIVVLFNGEFDYIAGTN